MVSMSRSHVQAVQKLEKRNAQHLCGTISQRVCENVTPTPSTLTLDFATGALELMHGGGPGAVHGYGDGLSLAAGSWINASLFTQALSERYTTTPPSSVATSGGAKHHTHTPTIDLIAPCCNSVFPNLPLRQPSLGDCFF